MTITISGSGTIGGPTTFTDNVTLGTSLLATPSGATPSYLCRAWVNFNGTGTVAIRGSGNVTSITDVGTGSYVVNFTTALSDANYATAFGGQRASNGSTGYQTAVLTKLTTSCSVLTYDLSTSADWSNVDMSIFR